MKQLKHLETPDVRHWEIFDQCAKGHATLTAEDGGRAVLLEVDEAWVENDCFLLRGCSNEVGVNAQFELLLIADRSLDLHDLPSIGLNMDWSDPGGILTFNTGETLQSHGWRLCEAVSRNMTWEQYYNQLLYSFGRDHFVELFGKIAKAKQVALAHVLGFQSWEARERQREAEARVARRIACPITDLLDKDNAENPLPHLVAAPETRFQANHIIPKLHEALAQCQQFDPSIELPSRYLR